MNRTQRLAEAILADCQHEKQKHNISWPSTHPGGDHFSYSHGGGIWPSTHPGGDHFPSSQQIFASSRRIPTAAEGARPQLSIVRIMNFLWTVCSVSCMSHFDSARQRQPYFDTSHFDELSYFGHWPIGQA